MTTTKLVGLAGLALASFVAGCATVRGGGALPDEATLDRAELARCAHDGGLDPSDSTAVSALAGTYRLYMFDEAGTSSVAGTLELRRPGPAAPIEVDPLAGPPPILVGHSDIQADHVGAALPGDVSSREPDAPGVGVYSFAGDGVRIRFGSESNRRGRTRFGGAHTTLTVSSIGADHFGGSWASAEGAGSSRGDFCAKRTPR